MSCGCRPSSTASLDATVERAVARGIDRRTALRGLAAMASLALAGCATIPELVHYRVPATFV